MHQNPNPNPNPQYSVLHPPNQSVCYSQNFVSDPYQLSNVDSHSALFLPPQPRPPGVDPPYAPPPPPPPAVNYLHQPIVFEAQQGVDAAAAAAAAYYPDPNVSWVAPTPQFGTTPYAAVRAPSHPLCVCVEEFLNLAGNW